MPWITLAMMQPCWYIGFFDILWSFGVFFNGFQLGGANVTEDVAICWRCCYSLLCLVWITRLQIMPCQSWYTWHSDCIILYHPLSNWCVTVWVKSICLDTLVHDGRWWYMNIRNHPVCVCFWMFLVFSSGYHHFPHPHLLVQNHDPFFTFHPP